MSTINKIKFAQEVKDKGVECEECHVAPPSPFLLSYHFNPFGTHVTSECGWWLRVSHHWELGYHGERREVDDTINLILCPSCKDTHNKRMDELLGDII